MQEVPQGRRVNEGVASTRSNAANESGLARPRWEARAGIRSAAAFERCGTHAFARITWTMAHAGFERLRTTPVCGPCVLARLGLPQTSRDCKPTRASGKCGLPAFAVNVTARIPGFQHSHVICGVPHGPFRQMVSRHIGACVACGSLAPTKFRLPIQDPALDDRVPCQISMDSGYGVFAGVRSRVALCLACSILALILAIRGLSLCITLQHSVTHADLSIASSTYYIRASSTI